MKCPKSQLNHLYSVVQNIDCSTMQYSSTVYRDHKGKGFLATKYHPKPAKYLLCDI